MLTGGSRLSIGIAAFSEAQQGEIENALDALAATDTVFEALLTAESSREEDDQFCGLFVKNLENIQGDERDIILMSVCYGRDPTGRVLMNFGPINQRGGEKRLNVIFSRAKHHMVLFSSLRHIDISNDYNDGANALKNFLHYAESLSRGDVALARQVLDGLNPLKRKPMALEQASQAVSEQIAQALRTRGWLAETQIGQSRFRCDVAVRANGDMQYQVGILLDITGNASVLERFHTQPAILNAFGWKTLLVLVKDWWREPQSVLERIERILRNETADTSEELLTSLVADPQPQSIVNAETETEQHPELPNPEIGVPDSPASQPRRMQRFEFIEGGSQKFWEIGQSGGDLTVRFGRIGTNGQIQIKTFPDEIRTEREVKKLIEEKVRKGYVEVL